MGFYEVTGVRAEEKPILDTKIWVMQRSLLIIF